MRLSFIVPGPPVPLARPRTVAGKGGKPHTYTPERSAKYEETVGTCARQAIGRGTWPKGAEYALTLHVVFADRRRRDLSNVLKAIEDGMIRIAFDDDSQIAKLAMTREYDKQRPRVEVTIEVMGQAAA